MHKQSLVAAFVGALAFGTAAQAAPEAATDARSIVFTDYHDITLSEDGFTVARSPESSPARDADIGDFTAGTETSEGCWVVLQYCDAPGPEGAVCTFTDCTIVQAVNACNSLIDQTCG